MADDYIEILKQRYEDSKKQYESLPEEVRNSPCFDDWRKSLSELEQKIKDGERVDIKRDQRSTG